MHADIIETALHLHFLKNAEYPETLEELATLVPEEVLIDPFSEERFVYDRTEEGYRFYSFGANLEDDGGEYVGFPFTEGDIVYPEREPETDEEDS